MERRLAEAEPVESPEERARCFGGLVSQELHALRSLTWSGVRLVRERGPTFLQERSPFSSPTLKGSTRLLHELGDGYADVLAEHRRVLREAFAEHGGVEVDTQGDAFFVAFARASDAVAGAQAAKDALRGDRSVSA